MGRRSKTKRARAQLQRETRKALELHYVERWSYILHLTQYVQITSLAHRHVLETARAVEREAQGVSDVERKIAIIQATESAVTQSLTKSSVVICVYEGRLYAALPMDFLDTLHIMEKLNSIGLYDLETEAVRVVALNQFYESIIVQNPIYEGPDLKYKVAAIKSNLRIEFEKRFNLLFPPKPEMPERQWQDIVHAKSYSKDDWPGADGTPWY